MIENIKKLYNFFSDDTPYYAASLSFFTIFSILPLLALLISIVSQMPNYTSHLDLLMLYIMDFINPTHSNSLSTHINSFLTNTDKLGNIGIFYLLFVFTMFFRDYEHVVNKIFNTKPRAIYVLFITYLAFMLLIPLLFTVYVFINTIAVFSFSSQIFAFIFIWIIFILLFLLSANTNVSFKAASFSSLATLVILSVLKNIFSYYVISNQTYSTIYGSFSVALFFFLWIYVSWNIYLYGIKFCSIINTSEKHYEN